MADGAQTNQNYFLGYAKCEMPIRHLTSLTWFRKLSNVLFTKENVKNTLWLQNIFS